MKKELIENRLFILGILISFIGLMSYAGLERISRIVEKKDAELTQEFAESAIIACYSREGSYPPDIKYLEDNYSLEINYDKYSAEYQIIGSNTKPTIIIKRIEAVEK